MSNAVHRLKTWPASFAAIWSGAKCHEVRFNDRHYQAGDVLELVEWNPETRQPSGREIGVRVSHVTAGGSFGLPDNLCVMSISQLARSQKLHASLSDLNAGIDMLRKVDADARRVEHYLGRAEPASPLLAEIRAFLAEVG
jgi:uncharacterized protein DUF3850